MFQGKDIIIAILFTCLVLLGLFSYSKIKHIAYLDIKLEDLNVVLVKEQEVVKQERLSKQVLQESINHQNLEVEKWRASNDATLLEYNKLLMVPEKVRFKDKYIEVESDECEDIKKQLDIIKLTNF